MHKISRIEGDNFNNWFYFTMFIYIL
jgi:hypothetical protein